MGGSRSPHAARGILLEVNQRKIDYFELKHHQPVLVSVPSGQNVFHHVTPVSFAKLFIGTIQISIFLSSAGAPVGICIAGLLIRSQ